MMNEWIEKKEKLINIVENELINGEGNTELENSHLATNLVKKQFEQESSMDTKGSRWKYEEKEDTCSLKACVYNLIITKEKE